MEARARTGPRPVDPIRHGRHLVLDEIGANGQARLHDAHVAIIGLGGLGCVVAPYLVAAGVGTLTLIDHDVVDVSNLQRQVLYGEGDIGRPKVEVATERLTQQDAAARVEPHVLRVAPETIDQVAPLLADADVICDAVDHLPTRYLLNDLAAALGKPLVQANVQRFEGQCSVYDPHDHDTPCYRCLFPVPPSADKVPSCAEAGVLGSVPGTMGTVQATETIKVLLERDDALRGRLLLYDALRPAMEVVPVEARRDCIGCESTGGARSADGSLDQGTLARIATRHRAAFLEVGRLAWSDLDGRNDIGLVDVRDHDEVTARPIEGALHVPLDRFPALDAIVNDPDGAREAIGVLLGAADPEGQAERHLACVCASGVRSLDAARRLAAAGFTSVGSVEGGLQARSSPSTPG